MTKAEYNELKGLIQGVKEGQEELTRTVRGHNGNAGIQTGLELLKLSMETLRQSVETTNVNVSKALTTAGQALEEARQAREESQKDLRSCQLASTGRVAELANTLSLVRQEKEQETKNEGTFGSWAWFRDGYLEKLVLIISGAGAMKVLDLLIIHWKP